VQSTDQAYECCYFVCSWQYVVMQWIILTDFVCLKVINHISFSFNREPKLEGTIWELNVKRDHSRSYDLNREPKLEGDQCRSTDLNREPKLELSKEPELQGTIWELNVKRDHSRSYDLNREPKLEGDQCLSTDLNREPKLVTTAGAVILIESRSSNL
jgi:hypothetical protein